MSTRLRIMPERITTPLPSSPRDHPARARRLELAAFVLLLVAEFLAFDLVGAKHQTWIYPRWNDQIQYLTEAYLRFPAVPPAWPGERPLAESLLAGRPRGSCTRFFGGAGVQRGRPFARRSPGGQRHRGAFLAWFTAPFLVVR